MPSPGTACVHGPGTYPATLYVATSAPAADTRILQLPPRQGLARLSNRCCGAATGHVFLWVKKLGYELNTAKYARQVVEKHGGSVRLHVMRSKGVTEVPVDQMVQVAEGAKVPLEVIEGGNKDYVLVA